MTATTCRSWCNAHQTGDTGHPDDSWCVHAIPLAGSQDEALWIKQDRQGRAVVITGLLPDVPELWSVEDVQDWALMYTKAATMLQRIQFELEATTPEAGL